MKSILCLVLLIVAVYAEEEKQVEKRAVLSGYPAVASAYHGFGAYPYSSAYGYPYGAAPYVPKVAAPLTYAGYHGYPGYHGYSGYHAAPVVAAKTLAPYSSLGYSSPYLGGYPYYH